MIYSESKKIHTARGEMRDITDEVAAAVAASGLRNGIVVVETAHSTAGIVRACAQGKEILEDITKETRRLVPARINFKHETSPEDAAGHIKSALFGSSVSLIVRDGVLAAQEKQGIYFVEYDGPRNRTYDICIVGE